MWRTTKFVFIAPLHLIKTVLVVLISAALLAISGHYSVIVNNGAQAASSATVVEVDDEEDSKPPEVPATPVPTWAGESWQKVQVVVGFNPHSKTFVQGLTQNGLQSNAFAKSETPKQYAVLPPIIVGQKQKPSSNPPLNPKPVAAALPKVRLSSDNWLLLTPPQKWLVANAYVKAHNWECDEEGLTRAQQIQKIADHPGATWAMVQNFGFTKCWTKKS